VKEAIRKERHKNQMETRKTLNKLRSGAGATTGTVEKVALNHRNCLLKQCPPLLWARRWAAAAGTDDVAEAGDVPSSECEGRQPAPDRAAEAVGTSSERRAEGNPTRCLIYE
jgi:hypothetical protein